MFRKTGLTQILVIFGVFMLFFGYRKLPELGKRYGDKAEDVLAKVLPR